MSPIRSISALPKQAPEPDGAYFPMRSYPTLRRPTIGRTSRISRGILAYCKSVPGIRSSPVRETQKVRAMLERGVAEGPDSPLLQGCVRCGSENGGEAFACKEAFTRKESPIPSERRLVPTPSQYQKFLDILGGPRRSK